MKVLLTHGYFISDDPREQLIMKPYPPLGILYISSYLKARNISCEVIDSTFISPDQWKQQMNFSKPEIIAIYVNLMTKIRVLDLISWLKAHPLLNTVPVVLGGPDVTHNAADYLKAGANMLVIGEGEESFYQICLHYFSNKKLPADTAGTAFIDAQGEVKVLPPREKIRDIDTLPFPDRAAIPMHLYLQAWKKHHGLSAMSVSTQRGCPYTCKWCSTAVYGQSYRRRSPANVAEELKLLVQSYAPDTFWFVDDVFTVSHKWLESFRNILRESGLKIRFECITRADRLNEDIIKLLSESGCFRVWIGAESGAQEIIDAMDRRVDVAHVGEMIRVAKKYGIQAGTFIMLGYPGENRRHISETIAHLKASLPDIFTITVAYPIKGTRLFEEIKDKLEPGFEWNVATDRQREFKRLYPKRYYEIAVRKVVNQVESHRCAMQGDGLSAKAFKHRLRYISADLFMRFFEWRQWMKN